ncbi:MAG: IS630 family transposase, partial [Acidimicrobiia bacterium]
MRRASPPLSMTDGQREILGRLARSRTAPHRDVTRAKALLAAGDGAANTAIAWELGVSASSVMS